MNKRNSVNIDVKKLDDYLKNNKISYNYINTLLNRSTGFIYGCLRSGRMTVNDYINLCKAFKLEYSDYSLDPIDKTIFDMYKTINTYDHRKTVSINANKLKNEMYNYYLEQNPHVKVVVMKDLYAYMSRKIHKSDSYLTNVLCREKINKLVLETICAVLNKDINEFLIPKEKVVETISEEKAIEENKESNTKKDESLNVVISRSITIGSGNDKQEYILLTKEDLTKIKDRINSLETQLNDIKNIVNKL